MRVYALTKLGKKMVDTKSEQTDEFRVLSHIRNNRTATDTELEVIGGERFVMRKLVERGLVKELTD
jgi:hypothetical protein